MNMQSVLIGALASVLMAGCMHQDRQLVSERYPDLKWGFTTQNFVAVTPVSVASAKGFIAYAKQQGYSWIELRDPNASLTLADCEAIASFARKNGIEINYSVQRGLLDDDFWDVFNKAVHNTAAFEGPGYFRALALIGDGQFGWTEKEFEKLVQTANQAAALAAQKGVRFTVENADTALDGRGKPYYGLLEFFEQTRPDVTLQLDTANLFTGPVAVTPAQAETFIRMHADRISYLHLKSAQDGQAMPYLVGNPLAFETIFKMMQQSGVYYIAIELHSGTADENQIYSNMASSAAYLVNREIISVK